MEMECIFRKCCLLNLIQYFFNITILIFHKDMHEHRYFSLQYRQYSINSSKIMNNRKYLKMQSSSSINLFIKNLIKIINPK
jgi:hypothetical protein